MNDCGCQIGIDMGFVDINSSINISPGEKIPQLFFYNLHWNIHDEVTDIEHFNQ